MKVLYVLNDSLNYGSSKAILYLTDALKDKIEYEFLLPCHGVLEEELKLRGIKYKVSKYFSSVKDLDNGEKKIKRVIKKVINKVKVITLSKYYKNRNIDIVHSVNSAIYIGALISKKIGVKHVQHIREFAEEDHNFTFFDKDYIYKLFNESDKIICVSNAVFDKYKKILNVNKMVRIYDGVRTSFFDKEKDDDIKYNILYTGTLSKTKGVFDACLAVESLVDSYPKIHLYIAGDGPLKEKIKKYISEKNITNNITLLGYVKDMKSLRRKTKIALVCSKCEALGLVSIEAMLSKCLVIGTNSGGTKEIVKENGLFYDYGDYKGLKEKIKSAFENEKMVDTLIEKAYKEALNFNIEKCAMDTFSVYEEIMK